MKTANTSDHLSVLNFPSDTAQHQREYPGDHVLVQAALFAAMSGPNYSAHKTPDVDGPEPMSLVLVGDGPDVTRLLESSLAPLRLLQRQMRAITDAADAEAIRERVNAMHVGPAAKLLDTHETSMGGLPGDALHNRARIGEETFAQFGCLLRPTFLIENFDPANLPMALGEALDGHLILGDTGGLLLERALRGKSANDRELAHSLAALLCGADMFEMGSRKSTDGRRLRHVHARLFSRCTRDVLKRAVLGPSPAAHSILRSALLVPAMPTELLEVTTLRRMARLALGMRRAGFEGNPSDTHSLRFDGREIHEHCTEFRRKLRALPDPVRPYFEVWPGLPGMLIRGYCAVFERPRDISREAESKLASAVLNSLMDFAWSLASRQRALLEDILCAPAEASPDHVRIAMMRKLATGPRTFRELLRTYTNQRKDEHLPVLHSLQDDGLVHIDESGRFALTEKGQQLLRTREAA